MKRRRFLGIVTTASVAGIAGCGGGGETTDTENGDDGETTDTENGDDGETTDSDDGSTQGDPQSSSVAVTEAYYTADSAEAASEFIHPESNHEPNSADYGGEFDIGFTDGEVIAEDVDVEALEAEALALDSIAEETLEDIRESEDVHLVEGTLVVTADGESSEITQWLLTATDDGDWYVLDQPAQTA